MGRDDCKSPPRGYNLVKDVAMKHIVLPLAAIIVGLAAAEYLFGIDIERLFEGFIDFLAKLFGGSG